MNKLTCEQLLQYLSDYIDQALEEELTEAARLHLATCQNCKVILDTTQKTIALMGKSIQRTIPADRRKKLFADLEQTFLKSKKM